MKKRITIPYALGLFFLLIVVIFSVIHINQVMVYNANSDEASELILAKQLSEEGGILSKNWYYSTELRVLNTNLVFAPLFRVFSDWHAVRVVGTAVLWIFLLTSAWWLCKEARIKQWFPVIGIMLLIPLSNEYYTCVITFPFYVPHVIITLLSVSLMILFINSGSSTVKYSALIGGGCLAFVAGLGGPRQVVICYFPLFVATVVSCRKCIPQRGDLSKKEEKRREMILFAGISLLMVGIGYVINEFVLHRMYSYYHYHISFSGFSFDRAITVITGLLSSYGYVPGEISAKTIICNGVGFVYFFFTIFCAVSEIRKNKLVSSLIAWLYVSGIMVLVLLYSFTDMSYENRYNIPLIPLSPFINAIWIKDIPQRKTRNLFCILWVVILCVTGINYYSNISVSDSAKGRKEMVNWLTDHDYHYGYATFWNANVMTELSNGAIEMHSWEDSETPASGNIDRIYTWLQLKRHESEIPQGKVFLLFSNNQISHEVEPDDNEWQLNQDKIIWANNEYTVYGYENYKTMKQETGTSDSNK